MGNVCIYLINCNLTDILFTKSMTECDNLLKQNLLPGVRIDKPSFKITRFSIAVNAYTRMKLMRHVSIHRV